MRDFSFLLRKICRRHLTAAPGCATMDKVASGARKHRLSIDLFRGVAQLVAREVWDFDAAGSNPVTPTSGKLPLPMIEGAWHNSCHLTRRRSSDIAGFARPVWVFVTDLRTLFFIQILYEHPHHMKTIRTLSCFKYRAPYF